ncbi:glycosyltransferase family 9 protein [Candidatus Sumerlaeota bacterium]|nr:glycosyltransferase family 9 protein [Candidatus Sumerlaeota bacterium]
MARGRLHSLRRSAKGLLLGTLGRLMGRSESVALDEIDWPAAKKVLLIRPNFRMGNLLITTTALPILRSNLPDAEIHMLCARSFSSLLQGHPCIDRLHTFTRGLLFNPFRLHWLMRRMRRERFDVVIDGTMTGSAALLTRWAGGRVRIGAGPKGRHFAFTTLVDEPPRRLWRVEAMRQHFASMGMSVPESAGMNVHLTEEELARGRERMRELDGDESTWITGVFVGARGDKRWPAERWGEVISRLWANRGEGEGLVVFHGPEERALVAMLRGCTPEGVPFSLSPNLREFAALVAQCRQFISSDTGPMHLACALGVPVVSLFWRKSWVRFAPQRPVDEVIHGDAMPTPDQVLAAHLQQRGRLRAGT